MDEAITMLRQIAAVRQFAALSIRESTPGIRNESRNRSSLFRPAIAWKVSKEGEQQEIHAHRLRTDSMDARRFAYKQSGKKLGESTSVSVQAMNVANRRLLLDNSFTFGGTHYLNPREIFLQIRYKFHY